MTGSTQRWWGQKGLPVNFGKLLHKEGLWSLYFYEDSSSKGSVLFHLCRGYAHRLENNYVEYYNRRLLCTECRQSPPEKIEGLWRLHNFDWIQEVS